MSGGKFNITANNIGQVGDNNRAENIAQDAREERRAESANRGRRTDTSAAVKNNSGSDLPGPDSDETLGGTQAAAPPPVKLFYSYAHKDEELRQKLETHLSLMRRSGQIAGWHDRDIDAGEEWKDSIDENLGSAQIILLLVSADFLASDYCYDIEMKRAMERHESREARIVPIILRPCDWHDAPFGKLQALPRNAKPITTWENIDEAYLDVVQNLRRVLKELGSSRS